MIVAHSVTEEIAREIDISLCDACGLLRMKGSGGKMNDDDLPRDVVAAYITQVRQDISRLTTEHRLSFEAIDRRLDTMTRELEVLKLAKAVSEGKSDGIKMVLGIIITLSTLLGGAVAWAVSHIPWSGTKVQ